MLVFYDYTEKEKWVRYYIEKFLPKCLYPAFVEWDYKKTHGNKEINLKNPLTFSEKLNYLKIFDLSPEKQYVSDKLTAKEYVKQKIPELNVAKVYTTASSFDELNFDLCPSKFILKTNHACKTGIVINNKDEITKEDYEKYRKYYKKVLSLNYAFWGTLELQYKDIKPQIYAEEYLMQKEDDLHIEYEVYCLNGRPEFLQYTKHNVIERMDFMFLDTNWNKTDFRLQVDFSADVVPNDYNKDKILEYSKILSKDFKFARIDFIEINNVLYFSEITFTPFSCQINFIPEKFDKTYGDKLII